MFSRKRNKMPNERTLYEGRPNMIFGCKKVIWGVIVLWLIMYISGPIKSAIINMQTYYISFIKFGIMGYVSLAFVVLMLLDLLYIIWQLLSWYFTVYTITNERIIIKKGVINSKKTYMPFRSIQDVNLSQNIFEKILNVGSVSAYSAYDNNDVKLANISNPGEVEDILFKRMNEEFYGNNNSRHQPLDENYNRGYKKYSKKQHKKHHKQFKEYPEEEYYSQKYENQFNDFDEDYLEDNHNPSGFDDYDYRHNQNPHYDDYSYDDEKYTKNAKRTYKQYEYEEYPSYQSRKPEKYDYEYYNDSLEDNINNAINGLDNNQYSSRNDYDEDELYYNDDDYDEMEDFYRDNKEDIYMPPEEEPDDYDKQSKNNREDIVRRHFDKFDR